MWSMEFSANEVRESPLESTLTVEAAGLFQNV
jgi:hypothetical protein